MKEGRASRTAEQNALFRALECARPASRRLLDDRFARGFLTWPLSLVAEIGRVPGLGRLVPWFIDRRWPGVRTSVVARSRLIDAQIEASFRSANEAGEPIEQLVILGAGYDSRAYRLPVLRGTTVFEVDHPDTQASKRRALEAVSAPLEHVRFAATDFHDRDLAAVMASAGFRASARSFILWEGVTNYLTEAAVDATLRWCARAPSGSRLLFTYVHRDVLTNPGAFVGTENLFAALERASERFTFGIDPRELAAYLAERGLVLESDVGAAEYRLRAYGEAARAMRGHEFYRVALARVGERVGARAG